MARRRSSRLPAALAAKARRKLAAWGDVAGQIPLLSPVGPLYPVYPDTDTGDRDVGKGAA